MDSRSRHLPALCSTAPFTLDSHGHPLRPGARITLVTHIGPSIPPPTISLPRILSSSFLLPQCRSPAPSSPQISAFSGFFLYLERSVFVCLLALATFIVFSDYLPPSVPLTFLSPSIPPCALTVNVEPGSTDATTLVPSFLLANTMDRTWKLRN